MWLVFFLLCAPNKEIDLNEALETPYRVTRMADYPNGPNTDGCEDSVEVVNGVMTYVRFGMDSGFFVMNPTLPLEQRLIPKPHPDFPYTTTMARFNLVDKPTLLPFNSNALNGCQHLNGDNLYFHSEANGVKTLYKGNVKTKRLEKMPFYADNPHLIDQNTILVDKDKDIWVVRKGWFGWYFTNANEYFRAPINTAGEDVQPSWYEGKLYFTRNYQEIFMMDPRTKQVTLLVKNKTLAGIGEPSMYKGKLYFLVCYSDGVNYDYDVAVGQ
jgi:hypothetical protein